MVGDKLRNANDAINYLLADTPHFGVMDEAADTIDALVAALQNMADTDHLCREDYDQAYAALALARGDG